MPRGHEFLIPLLDIQQTHSLLADITVGRHWGYSELKNPPCYGAHLYAEIPPII